MANIAINPPRIPAPMAGLRVFMHHLTAPLRAYGKLCDNALERDPRTRRAQALFSLSDGELATLGLTRAGIAAHVYGGAWPF